MPPHAVHAVLLIIAVSKAASVIRADRSVRSCAKSIKQLKANIVCCRQFDHDAYQQWQQQTLDEAAYESAEHAAVEKLMLLLHRHPHRLMPGLLDVMSHLPETAAVDVYAQLLDQVSDGNSFQFFVLFIYLFIYFVCFLD